MKAKCLEMNLKVILIPRGKWKGISYLRLILILRRPELNRIWEIITAMKEKLQYKKGRDFKGSEFMKDSKSPLILLAVIQKTMIQIN